MSLKQTEKDFSKDIDKRSAHTELADCMQFPFVYICISIGLSLKGCRFIKIFLSKSSFLAPGRVVLFTWCTYYVLPSSEPQPQQQLQRFCTAYVILLYLALCSHPVACLEFKPYIPVNNRAVAFPFWLPLPLKAMCVFLSYPGLSLPLFFPLPCAFIV